MARLSITRAWNEAAAFVAREARLLMPLAFMLVALPSALMQAVMPPAPAPGALPPAGLWLLFLVLALVGRVVGSIAIAFLALRPGTAVGEAIGRGVRRFLPLFAAGLMLAAVAAVLLIVSTMLIVALVPGAMEAAQAGTATPAVARASLLAALLPLPLLVWIGARLVPTTGVAAAEEGGPVALIARSWRLSAGHGWKLVGLVLLVGIAVVVTVLTVQLAVGVLLVLIAGPIEPGSTSMLLLILVMAAVNTVVTVYVVSLVARIYAQLAGGDPGPVFG